MVRIDPRFLFDLDGTLVDSVYQHVLAWKLAERPRTAGIVRDLAGERTLGVVTLEDVLHSLVGDVREAKLR